MILIVCSYFSVYFSAFCSIVENVGFVSGNMACAVVLNYILRCDDNVEFVLISPNENEPDAFLSGLMSAQKHSDVIDCKSICQILP